MVEAHDLVQSVSVDSTSQARTAQVWTRSADGTVLAQDTVVTSADGLDRQSTMDADGDGDVDVAISDVTLQQGDGSTVQTVETRNGDGSLRTRVFADTSADGLTAETVTDRDGDGILDGQSSDVRSTSADGGTIRTVTQFAGDGTTVLSQSVTEQSADRRVTIVTQDVNGDGNTDAITQRVEATDGSVMETTTQYAADGSVVTRAVTEISDDALEQTSPSDLDGDGSDDVVSQRATTLNQDGSRSTTSEIRNQDGSLRSKTETQVTDDRLTTTVHTDADGDGIDERETISTTTLNSDGSQTTVDEVRAHSGAVLTRTTRDVSDDGLSVTVSTDADADGSMDLVATDTTTLLQDGSTRVVSEVRDATGALRSSQITETDDVGRETTTTTDLNEDGVVDSRDTTVIADDGSVTLTVAQFDAQGGLQARSQTVVSGNGLLATTQTDTDGDGVYERSTHSATVLNADGSRSTTVSERSEDGTVYRSTDTTVSDDGLTVTEDTDLDGDGQADLTMVTTDDLSVDGVATLTVTDAARDGSIISTSTTQTSADGRSIVTEVDVDGNGQLDERVTTTLEDDGDLHIVATYHSVGGTEEARRVETVSANGFDTAMSVDRDGDGVFEYTAQSTIDLTSSGETGVTATYSAADGALLARTQTLVSDDGFVTEVSLDLDGDGQSEFTTTDTTTFAINGDTTREAVSYVNSAEAARIVELTSGDGLTMSLSTDFSGDGQNNKSIDTVYGASGGMTREVNIYAADGALDRKEIQIVSADGWTETLHLDRDGDGILDREIVSQTDLSRDVTITYRDIPAVGIMGANFVSKTSANGLHQETGFDLNGDGISDIMTDAQTSFDLDGSQIVTFSETMGAGTLTYQAVTTTAANGLTESVVFDADGDGTTDGTATTVTTMLADGSRETVHVIRHADGDLQIRQVETVSADGLSRTETVDYDGDGQIDVETQFAISASGVSSRVEISYDASGTETGRAETVVSFDGLVSSRTQDGIVETTVWNVTGNGSYVWDNGITPLTDDDVHFNVSHQVDGLGIDTWTSVRTWLDEAGASQSETASVRLDVDAFDRIRLEAERLYDTALDRELDDQEYETLVRHVSAAGILDQESLMAELLASDEFAMRYGTLANASYIQRLYENTFDRAPSMAEVDAHLTVLETGVSHAEFAVTLADSIEHIIVGNVHNLTNNYDLFLSGYKAERQLDRTVVETELKQLFDTLFDRAPTQVELAYFGAEVLDGRTSLEALTEQWLNPMDQTEGVATSELASLTGEAFVDLAYQNATARAATPDEINIWSTRLADGDLSEVEFLLSLSRSVDKKETGETGETLQIGEVAGNASAHLDLTALNLDGAIGDDRDNELRAIGHIASVQISGGAGNDLIRGGWADDFLSGGEGIDNIDAGEGDDLIYFDADDWIHGAGGWDTAISAEHNLFDEGGAQTYVARRIDLDLQTHSIEAYRGSDGVDNVWVATGYTTFVNVSLGNGNDTATGGAADDVLSGDGGDDLLAGNRGNDVLSGGELQDTLNGGEGDDLLLGDRGNDSVLGGEGDDRAYGGEGADTIDGGQGDDSLYGSDGDDSLFGGTDGDDLLDGGKGNDNLDGGIGDDFIIGGEGNDTLTAAHGDDYLDGGLGNDVFALGTGDNTALGGEGDDRFWAIEVHGANVIQGGVGFDTIVLQGDQSDYSIVNSGVVASLWHIRSSATGSSPINIVFQDIEQVQFGNGQTLAVNGADASADTSATFVDFVSSDPQARHDAYGDLSTLPSWMFIGANSWEGNFHTGNDSVFGTGSTADINLGSGDDNASTGTGNDSVLGDTGNDSISGGEGADVLNGQTGSDEIYGGTQNDQLHGGSGSDLLDGGDQEDLLRGGSGSDVLLGGNGFDTIYGGDGGDIIFGGAQADNLFGEGGNDLLEGEHGADHLFGGDGSDELFGGDANDVLWGEVGNDVLRGGNDHDRLYGQNGNDRLFGDNGHDTLDGGYGQDWLDGGALADNLEGGEGDDYLFGGDGADVLHGGNGTDYLEGGAGADVINGGSFPTDVASYASSDAAVSVDLTTGTASGGHATGDTLISIEALQGSDHNDTLIGEGSANILDGGIGDDSLVGYGGNDHLFGQGGNDTLRGDTGDDNLYGGADNDHLFGGSDNDVLRGGTGDDTVLGEGGFDTISGGAGNDSLTGGGNWDVFEFNDDFGNDTITDFDFANAFEHIDLSEVSGFSSFADLSITASGPNVLIDFGQGNTLTLLGVSAASLTADEFVF